MRWLSGDKDACLSHSQSLRISDFCSELSARITQMSSLSFSADVKAIQLPSGAHTGS